MVPVREQMTTFRTTRSGISRPIKCAMSSLQRVFFLTTGKAVVIVQLASMNEHLCRTCKSMDHSEMNCRDVRTVDPWDAHPLENKVFSTTYMHI